MSAQKSVTLGELMQKSGVQFGTSGARGLVTQLTDRVAYAYTGGFLQYLEKIGAIHEKIVAVAGDRRSSTPRIKNAALRAAVDRGYQPRDCGLLPSPALALYGLEHKVPSVMVTGSHIPDDRNGIKFNTPEGEILKRDEAGIVEQRVEFPFEFTGADAVPDALRLNLPVDGAAERAYVARYTEALPSDALSGLRVGVYGHSAVGRELLVRVLGTLGAEVTPLGYSDAFVAVDTEAIRPDDVKLAREWSQSHRFDSVVSTDGDSDRPLVSDEHGHFLRGDVAGILTAKYLGARAVVTPVSSNSAAERSSLFQRVLRTRIGSPYVIEAMQRAVSEGDAPVVGYEANGGFLIASPIELEGRGKLAPLATRDAVIVLIAILRQSKLQGRPISALVLDLPARFTASNRIANFPTEVSKRKLEELSASGEPAVSALFRGALGPVRSIDTIDGVRVEFESTEIVHLRASGNAPELRCYSEASSEDRAKALTSLALEAVARWR